MNNIEFPYPIGTQILLSMHFIMIMHVLLNCIYCGC